MEMDENDILSYVLMQIFHENKLQNFFWLTSNFDILSLSLINSFLFRTSIRYKQSSNHQAVGQLGSNQLGSSNNINLDEAMSPSLRRKIRGRESPTKMQ